MKQYQLRLRQKGITQSMSRKGNCLDNAAYGKFLWIIEVRIIIFAKILIHRPFPKRIGRIYRLLQ